MRMQLDAVRAREGVLPDRYASVAQAIGVGVKAVRGAVQRLVTSRWLTLGHVNRVAPVSLVVRDPIRARFAAMKAMMQKDIARAKFKGEAIMIATLWLLVGSEHGVNHASPDFLVTRDTSERMHIDRYHPTERVGVEFNGPQHDHATLRYGPGTVERQRICDAMKLELCVENGVHLITVRAEDLSLEILLGKLRGWLPLRNLLGAESVIRFLGKTCSEYRRACAGGFATA
jgi:hypothetical protein